MWLSGSTPKARKVMKIGHQPSWKNTDTKKVKIDKDFAESIWIQIHQQAIISKFMQILFPIPMLVLCSLATSLLVCFLSEIAPKQKAVYVELAIAICNESLMCYQNTSNNWHVQRARSSCQLENDSFFMIFEWKQNNAMSEALKFEIQWKMKQKELIFKIFNLNQYVILSYYKQDHSNTQLILETQFIQHLGQSIIVWLSSETVKKQIKHIQVVVCVVCIQWLNSIWRNSHDNSTTFIFILLLNNYHKESHTICWISHFISN